MQALLIGGGIAGPALALFLRRLGSDVTLCEARSGEQADEGLFLSVAPNGMNVLRELGLADAVSAVGTICRGFDFMNARGRVIARIDNGQDEERYGAPQVLVRRADLNRILLDAARHAGVTVHRGARLTGLRLEGARVRAVFEDGAERTADFVVGADGLRSRVRGLILPEAPAPAFLGQLDFGGYCPAGDVPLEVARNVMVFGRRAFFGAFRKPDGEAWWFHNGGEQKARPALDPQDVRGRIIHAHRHDPSWIRELVERTPTIRGPWPLCDIRSLPRWHADRVCVIGDAAHATSPSSGQGVSLALEDAMTLARCLRDQTSPERAFVALEDERRVRVEAIVEQSRRYGSPKVASSAASAWLRDRMLPLFLRFGAKAQRELHAYRVAWD